MEATGHPNIISRIQTDVVNGVWQVELESGNYGEYELTCYITLPAINRVISIGTGDVKIEGSGNVYFKGAPTIKQDITGSGSIVDSN